MPAHWLRYISEQLDLLQFLSLFLVTRERSLGDLVWWQKSALALVPVVFTGVLAAGGGALTSYFALDKATAILAERSRAQDENIKRNTEDIKSLTQALNSYLILLNGKSQNGNH